MRLAIRCFVLAFSFCTPVLAQTEAPSTSPAAPVRRDPKGVTGVSPLWERLAKGDAAAAAHDLDGALALYREAVTENPEEPLGHYRVGQCETLRGNLKEAEIAYTDGLRFADKDPSTKAKLLFALAGVHERQKAFDQAIARYEEYEALARANAKAKTHPMSAADRKKRNQEWQRIQADSAEVKARIDKRAKGGPSAPAR